MKYRYFMIAIAMLLFCVGCVSALTISTTTVSTADGQITRSTSSSSSTGLDNGVSESDVETKSATTLDEVYVEVLNENEADISEELETESLEEIEAESLPNSAEISGFELIVRFEPELFELSDGTLNALAMEEVEFEAHDAIGAVVLSDLTDIGMPGLQLIRLPDGMSIEEGIAHYESLFGVRFAEPNYQISIASDDSLDDGSIVTEKSDSDI